MLTIEEQERQAYTAGEFVLAAALAARIDMQHALAADVVSIEELQDEIAHLKRILENALADHHAGPVVVVLPSTQTANTKTPAGRAVVVCPATQRDDVTCASCQLCQRQRDVIVGFPAHGTRRRVIDIKLAA